MKHFLVAAFVAFLVAFSTACGGVPVVEVQGVQFEGEADARILVPVVINGVPATGVAQCSVATDEGLPLCFLCVSVADSEVCQCFKGIDRVPCTTPEPALEEPVEGESVEEEPVEEVTEGEEVEETPEVEEEESDEGDSDDSDGSEDEEDAEGDEGDTP